MAVAPSDLSHFDAVARTSNSKAPYPTVTEAVFCISSLSSLPTDEQEDPDRCETGNISRTRDTSPMRLDWTAPVNRSSSNSVSNTRQPSVSAEQDPLRPLPDPCIAMMPITPMPNTSPSKSPSFYSGELSSLLSFPFGPSPPHSSEAGDHFPIEQPSEMQINENGSIALSHASSGKSKPK